MSNMEAIKVSMILSIILLYAMSYSNGESVSCTAVYNEGSAAAVFQSSKCPQWSLSTQSLQNRTMSCQSAILQGRRKYQEDRVSCDLDMKIPFFGNNELKVVTVGIAAVFDGHGGAQASEMASNLLLDYFLLHVHFIRDETYSLTINNYMESSPFHEVHDLDRYNSSLDSSERKLSMVFDDSIHMEILKEALTRTIRDIDIAFTKEANKYNLDGGCTATVVLLVDGQILVAYVGDSKAFLCSEKFQTPKEIQGTILEYKRKRSHATRVALKDYKNLIRSATANGLMHLSANELTRDHHPDQDDERSRIEAAGGYVVSRAGVPRVNGQLAVSRSIGDLYYKRYGVISLPEVTDWRPLSTNDSYLMVSSDGIFEKLTAQNVCDLLPDPHIPSSERLKLFSTCENPLAECILKTAFEEGSMDNLSVIVIPLRSSRFLGSS